MFYNLKSRYPILMPFVLFDTVIINLRYLYSDIL